MKLQISHTKKQMLIFGGVAIGLPGVMGMLMRFGYYRKLDIGLFPLAQMIYPAAGVMLAALLTRKGDPLIPRRFFTGFLTLTALILFCSVASIMVPGLKWLMIAQVAAIVGSIVMLMLLLTEKQEKRIAYGLKGGCWKSAARTILLFLVLYFARSIIRFIVTGDTQLVFQILRHRMTWWTIIILPVNYLMTFTSFLGEEYGWRYFLQPVLQKKFGMVRGIFLLGLVWGLWHWPLDFFYYTSPADGFVNVLTHLVNCTTLSLFWGWVYLKTDNIWTAVILHFLNNNLSGIAAGSYLADVAQNQGVAWKEALLLLVLNALLFGAVLFTKDFRDYTRRLPTMDERADQYKITNEIVF